ncbi:MAG: VWA domain-containing protein [Bdellovibrionales bacterium]|nr:VWA domain-containing protein [Bdellovibrionales bacterium]
MGKFKFLNIYFIVTLLLVSIYAFQNCGEYKLLPEETVELPLEIDSKFCLEPPEKKTKWSKIVFVVDVSGSNATGNSSIGGPPTDPDKSRRSQAIETFVNKYRNNEYYKWSMIMFHGDAAIPLVTDGDSPIFSDVTALDQAIETFKGYQDIDGTPYLAALTTVESLIENDIEEHPDELSTFNIFFLSDGRPTPQSNDGCETAECIQIETATKDVKSIDPSNVFLSTVYYYTSIVDTPAARGLEKMAEWGGGSYSNAGENEKIEFNEVRVGERPEPWVIKSSKLIAYNLNSGFCTDGTIDADSDADGICDKDEIKYNEIYKKALENQYDGKQFDPYNRNSFDEKYSDSFVWKFNLTANASGLGECPDLKDDEDMDFLNNCEELMLKDQNNANGPTSQWTDYLISQQGGAADPLNFDSDGDLFLDFIEFFQFRLESGISPSVDYQSRETVYPGGLTAEQLILEHRHFMTANTNINPTYEITTQPLGINDETGEQCYTFDLNPIPIYDTKEVSTKEVSGIRELKHADRENLMMVYFIATPEDQRHGKGALYWTIKPLLFGQDEGIKKELKIEDFQYYRVPYSEND